MIILYIILYSKLLLFTSFFYFTVSDAYQANKVTGARRQTSCSLHILIQDSTSSVSESVGGKAGLF